MCGIAGCFNWDPQASVDYAALRHAAARMALRGPDADGFYERQGVGFAHRRLSVIDLVGGRQPMIDKTTGVALTYNGEIYNFRELRETLCCRGHQFESLCDTEVLLRAYLEWGAACLSRLVGIFAFGIYDPRDETLFLARDRVGAKPLYYAQTPDGIVFASTVAALRTFEVGTEIDHEAVLHYFTTIRTTFGRQTLLKNIQTLEPGTCLIAGRNPRGIVCRPYWEFPVVRAEDKNPPAMKEAVDTVRDLVNRAVKEQMVSDVPLGGFLSGGIDSTVIASIAAEHGRFGAYSVGYGEQDCNEWPYVRLAAQTFKLPCKEIHLDAGSFVQTWKFLIGQKGLPLSTPNEIPIYHLAHALKQDYTVALSGEGADELFGGYVIPYFSAFDFDRARRSAPRPEDLLNRVDRAMIRFYQQPHLPGHVDHHFLLNSWMGAAQQSAVLHPDLFGHTDAVQAHYRNLMDRFEGCSTLDKHMHLHARINLEGLLNRVDTSTMAASVETRVPFTDHRLAEYLFGLPDDYKMSWRDAVAEQQGRIMNVAEIDQRNLIESKVLLRRAFQERIPAEIMSRRKVSFPVPFREWLGGSLRDFAEETISGSGLIEQTVQPAALRAVLDGPESPAAGMLLWPLVNLALWEKECLV
jgi:asparagine synthase (glutamine-hydrolysing)